jgi:tRNA(Ile)-lysidine synthase TilS/MesJ/rhodanese-related sulfurtransferase
MHATIDITLQEWRSHPEAYQIIDIRDAVAFTYGHIPGAIHIPLEELQAQPDRLPQGKKLLLCCKSGQISAPAAEALQAQGYDAYSFAPGYHGWLRDKLLSEEQDRSADIEKSIRKKFHRQLWTRFARAIMNYELVQPGDRIAVCISGGKDSMLMAKLFQELKHHNKFPFEVEFLVMDPGYSPANREIIERNLRILNIPAHIFETDIFDSVFHVEKSPCYLCARMRRGYLYKEAQKLGCNKIALGHHFDDVIETNLMGMLHGGQVQTMMPKLHSTNHPGMELIRPMYLIREEDIKHWRDYNDLHFLQCACKFTETCTTCHTGDGPTGSKRQETKDLIRMLKETNPQVEYNIFHALENVNLSTVLAWKDSSGQHSFLDTYDQAADPSEES